MGHSIFINYRRLDAQADAGRLLATLHHKLGHSPPFLDTSSLAPGAEWPPEIKAAITSADTVVVLIGPDWLRAGADSFGQRPIDSPTDWVRLEIETALEQRKRVIPVLLREAKMPPPEALPASIRLVSSLQAVDIRSAYWDHDVKLLIGQLKRPFKAGPSDDDRYHPYPVPPPVESVLPLVDEQLSAALADPLKGWQVVTSPLSEKDATLRGKGAKLRRELFREYAFATFQDAIAFMHMVAPGCDAANHHPRWENIWRTLSVYLTTWNIGHDVSDRDIQLAKYFDSAYASFSGRAK
jgi:pterin-4a-carbinolamine dehydratase